MNYTLVRLKNIISTLLILAILSSMKLIAATNSNQIHGQQSNNNINVPAERAEVKYYEERENRRQLGKYGLWLGLGGAIAGSLFDARNLRAYRTASYTVWGLGWAAWLGSLSEDLNVSETESQQPAAKSLQAPYQSASLQGAIGEASNMHLIPEGIYFHPLYNDMNGGTDKLLTGSAKLGWLQSFEGFSIESILYWRLLTPSYKSEFGSAELPHPVGRFADWNEWKTAVAKDSFILGTKLRNQVSVGYSDISDKGGKDFHQSIHRLTRNSMDHLEYFNQPKGRFFTLGFESGIETKLCPTLTPCLDNLVSFQAEQSKMMSESGMQWNTKMVMVPKWWEQALEIRLMRQWSSQVYDEILPWRYEGAVGVRLFSVFAPTLKYVSPYLHGDGIGQTYFDFFHYNYAF